MPKNYELVRSLRPGKSKFDLSYSNISTVDMGYVYPMMVKECITGDIWDIGTTITARMMPLVSPVLHPIQIKTATIFVPFRILDENFEVYLTGGEDGSGEVGGSEYTLPLWSPSSTAVGSLWDYVGLPVGVDPTGHEPYDYIRQGYVRIWNEYFRDQNVVEEKDESTTDEILKCAWRKDYFNAALPWQQRGTAPALPVTGTTFADFTNAFQTYSGTNANSDISIDTVTDLLQSNSAESSWLASMNKNEVDFANASTFDVSDIRRVAMIQQWMERNARTGARYTEFLKSHFGVAPSDARLQRPEYIGGSRTPIIVSEVLQTSESNTTPLGELAGHGITVDGTHVGKYRVEEPGLMYTLMWIMPENLYQQGVDKTWHKETRYDFPFPEFVGLSEQQIYQAEIYASGTESENLTVFGFQGQYDEYRQSRNMVTGLMRTDFDHWHLSRQFSSAPLLNEAFIYGTPRKDIFAVPSEPGFVVSVGNLLEVVRPLPFIAEPGIARL